MTKAQLRNVVGFVLVGIQVVSLFAVIIGFFAGGFQFTEMTTTVGMISPIVAAYTTVVVQFALRDEAPPPTDRKRATALLVLTAITFPVAFGAVVLGSIVAWMFGVGFGSFEEFKVVLGLGEVAFGVYLSRLVKGLFGLSVSGNGDKNLNQTSQAPQSN